MARTAIERSDQEAGPAWIEGKDERLEVLSEAPLVLATPISLLAGQRITEKDRLFVRNMEQVEYEMVLQCSGNGRVMYPGIPDAVDPGRCGPLRGEPRPR